jgi:DNA-directed RNA polymerase subunit beta
MAIKKIIRNTFGVRQYHFDVPNLNAMQINSYKSFWSKELVKILAEFSPIEDSAGRCRVELGPDFYLEPGNDLTDQKALLDRISYSAPLYITVSVENLVTKEKKKQRVFVGYVPLMTKKGNFIINGVQKIVVSQLVKSPGLLYTREIEKNVPVYTARVIPNRGVWLDILTSPEGVIYAKIDRKKRFPITQLFKLFGIIKEEEILDLFRTVDTDEKISYIQNTLEKDNVFGVEDAVNSIYKKIRPGDIISIEQGRKYLLSLFQDPAKYDFGEVGRYKFDTRLNLKPKSGDTSD